MWRGRDFKSMYPLAPPTLPIPSTASELGSNNSESDDYSDSREQNPVASPRMMSLWKRAIESNKAIKAMLLKETKLGPDSLLEKVEEFERVNQTAEHSYPVVVLSGSNPKSLAPGFRDRRSFDNPESGNDSFSDDEDYDDSYSDGYDDLSVEDPLEEAEPNVPLGSLPVDFLERRLEGD